MIVPALATEKLQNQVEPGLPRISLDLTIVDASARHHDAAVRTGQDSAPAPSQAERTKRN